MSSKTTDKTRHWSPACKLYLTSNQGPTWSDLELVECVDQLWLVFPEDELIVDFILLEDQNIESPTPQLQHKKYLQSQVAPQRLSLFVWKRDRFLKITARQHNHMKQSQSDRNEQNYGCSSLQMTLLFRLRHSSQSEIRSLRDTCARCWRANHSLFGSYYLRWTFSTETPRAPWVQEDCAAYKNWGWTTLCWSFLDCQSSCSCHAFSGFCRSPACWACSSSLDIRSFDRALSVQTPAVGKSVTEPARRGHSILAARKSAPLASRRCSLCCDNRWAWQCTTHSPFRSHLEWV